VLGSMITLVIVCSVEKDQSSAINSTNMNTDDAHTEGRPWVCGLCQILDPSIKIVLFESTQHFERYLSALTYLLVSTQFFFSCDQNDLISLSQNPTPQLPSPLSTFISSF
jgi:hypothetical protein